MTYLEAQTQLMADLNDDSPESLARVKNWLNRSKDRIVGFNPRWSFTQKIVQQTTTAGTSSFAATVLDADIKGVGEAYNRDEDWHICPLHHLDFFTYWPVPADEDSGSPEYMTVKVDDGVPTVYFNKPLAQNANLDWKITLKVADLSVDGDTPPWDEEHDFVWLLGAEYYGLKFNDRFEEARIVLADFQRELRAWKGRDSANLHIAGVRFQTPRDTSFKFGRPMYPARWLYIGQ